MLSRDGFVCILRKIFCILYHAFVRHNIPIRFVFYRSAHGPLPWYLSLLYQFTSTLLTIWETKAKTCRDRNWPSHPSLQMCKITSGGKLCFSRTKSKTWVMHVKAAVRKRSLASDIIEIFSLIRSPFYGDSNKLWKLKRNLDQCKRSVFHLAECCYSFHYTQHTIKPRFHQVFLI